MVHRQQQRHASPSLTQPAPVRLLERPSAKTSALQTLPTWKPARKRRQRPPWLKPLPARHGRTQPRNRLWVQGALLCAGLPLLVWGWQLWVCLGLSWLAAGWVYAQPGPWASQGEQPPASNQRLPWLMGIAGLLTFALYSALQIWHSVHSLWLAVVLLVQTLALSWILASRNQASAVAASPSLDAVLADLDHPTALRRRLAIQQLLRWAAPSSLPSQRQVLGDCLQLLLQQESDPLVRQAAWGVLQQLEALPVPLPQEQHP